jgi:hypothetical protein
MRFTCGGLLIAIAVIGCDAPRMPPPGESAAPAHPSSPVAHDSVLSGRVVWAGTAPQVAPVTALRIRADGSVIPVTRPDPNIPAIGPDGGVNGAVVFLRGVDSAKARAWDMPPVTVEMHDDRPMIRQGDGPLTNVGFVRRGDPITIVSRQPLFHALRARGAAFWTITLPDPDHPRTRRLEETGVIELSSGAYYFWMTGYLWVCEHPYYAATDATGRWTLKGVPPGDYELVAWLPDWRTERQERDPETGRIARYIFKPPMEVTQRVVVGGKEPTLVGDIRINP